MDAIISSFKLKRGLWLLWGVIAFTILLTWLTPLEFKSETLATALTILATTGFPVIKWLTSTEKGKRVKWLLASIAGVILPVIILALVEFVTWGGNHYKTQTILYRQNGHPNNRIENQWSDVGAFGYNRRTVKIIQVTPLLQWTTEFADETEITQGSWTRVDEYVNELGLKGG